MNSHTSFDADNDWTLDPYHCNRSNDPLVDKLIGNAYHVVRTVYCNLGNLKRIYDFLNQYGMVLGVQSEDELKAMTVSASYVRLYGFDNTNKRTVTDYLYVEGDRTGVIPDDPTATGSWILVASSTTGGGGDDDDEATPPYIIYTYNQGAALGGETTIPVPAGTVGVPMIVVEGQTNIVGYGFEYNATTLTVTLAQSLETGDEVHLFLTGTPAVPDNPNVTDWVQINWLYNGGYASGGEQVIQIPYTFQSVPAIYKNGERYYQGLAYKSYTVDADNQRILLTEPLATNDRLIVTIGGESTTLIMSDRTIQEVARSTNVHENEVILSTNTTQYLNGMKVIYDVVAQKSYSLPTLPTNVYINSVSNGQLTYSPGNITVDLLPAPGSQDAIEEAVDAAIALDTPSTKVTMVPGGTLNQYLLHVVPETFPGADDTARIQAAIDYVSGLGGGVVELSAKMYRAAGIVLKPMVYLKGQGVNLTVIKAPDGWDEVAVIYSVDFTEYVDQDKSTLPINGAYGAAIHKLHINGNYDNFAGTPARLYGHGLALGGLIHLSEVEVMYCPSSCLLMFNYQGGPNQPPSWWPADKGLYANAVHGDVACKWAGYDTIIMYTPDNVFSNLLVGMSARGQGMSDMTTRSLWDPSRICVVADFLSGVTILKGHFYAGLVGAIFRGWTTRWDYIVMETVSVGFWTTTASQVQGGISDIHNCNSALQLTGIPSIGNACPAFIIESGGTGTSNSELASDYGTINVLNYTVSSTKPDIYFCGAHGWINGKHNQVKVNIQRSRFLAEQDQRGGIGLILQGKQCSVTGQIVGFWKTDYSGNTSCAVQVQPDASFKVDLTIARCALGFRWSSSARVSGVLNFSENVSTYTEGYGTKATANQLGILSMHVPSGGNRCKYTSASNVDVTTTATQTINVPTAIPDSIPGAQGLPYIPRLGEVTAEVVNKNQPQGQYPGVISVQYEPASSTLTNLVFKVRMRADPGDAAGAVLVAKIG